MSTGDHYTWSGPTSGKWSVAANWTDTTTGQDPAPNPPGTRDYVTIPDPGRAYGVPLTQTITGNAAAISLTVGGTTNFAGTFSFGSLILAGGYMDGGGVSVTSGASLKVARDVTFASPDSVGGLSAYGGSIRVSGNAVGVPLSAINGGSIQIAGVGAGGSVDSTSWIELGTTGGAQPGSIQIDTGHTINGGVTAPTVVNYGAINNGIIYATNVTNTGSITGVQFHQLVDNSGVNVNNSGTITLLGDWMTGPVVNTGLLIAGLNSSDLGNMVGDITGTGQIQVAAGSTLQTGTASAGQTITFTGPGGALNLFAAALDSSKTYGATLSGFAASDAIFFHGTATSAAWQAGSGVLSLMNGASVVAQFHLAGDYSGQTFRTVALGGETVVFLGGGADTARPPSGTAANDHYVWSSPGPGSWDAAANWTDTTTGANPAAVAPGVHDSVTINARDPGTPQVITGTGNSASLTIAGDTVLAGAFTTGSLSFTGGSVDTNDLWIYAGDSLTVNGDADRGPGGLHVAGGTVKITGTLTGGLDASNGGVVHAGSVAGVSAFLDVDSTSSIDVGTKSAAAGSITVDVGATATLVSAFAPTVVNKGTLNGVGAGYAVMHATQVTNTGTISGFGFAQTDFGTPLSVVNSTAGVITLTSDSISGSLQNTGLLIAATGASGDVDRVGNITGAGQIHINAGAQLITGAGGSQTITFMSSTGQLDIGPNTLNANGAYTAKIAGFVSGDVIDWNGTVTAATWQSSGDLTLFNNGVTVARVHLIGDYTGDTFNTAAMGGGDTQITVIGPHSSSAQASSASMTTDEVSSFSFDQTGGHGAAGPGFDPVSLQAETQSWPWDHHPYAVSPDFIL